MQQTNMAGELPQKEKSSEQDVEQATVLDGSESETSLKSYLEGWRFYGTIFGEVAHRFVWASSH